MCCLLGITTKTDQNKYYINKNINLLNNDGRLVNIGFQNGSKAEINLMKVMLKRLTITGSTLRIRDNSFKSKILNSLIKFVFPQIEKKKLKFLLTQFTN